MPPQPATDPHVDSDIPVGTTRRRGWAWIGLLVPLAALGAVVVIDSLTDQPAPAVVGQPAPDFTLPDTTGGTESLDEALTEGSEGVVVYFSMGVGCGGCFGCLFSCSFSFFGCFEAYLFVYCHQCRVCSFQC